MDDWSYREILEISSVFVAFFAPVLIALFLFYLVSNVIHQASIHNNSPSVNTLGNIIMSLLVIVVFTYIEIRLLRWLTTSHTSS